MFANGHEAVYKSMSYRPKQRTDNESLESFVVENINVIENILFTDARDFLHIQRQKSFLDFGPKVNESNLEKLASPVMKQISDFLNVGYEELDVKRLTFLDHATMRNFNIYIGVFGMIAGYSVPLALTSSLGISLLMMINSSEKLKPGIHDDYENIFVSSGRLFSAVNDIAHVYTHKLQSEHSIDLFEDGLSEGHATNLAHLISKKYADVNNNPAFIFHSLLNRSSQLKAAYVGIGKKHGINLRSTLLNSPLPKQNIFRRNSPHYNPVSVASVAIAEKLYGDSIYTDMVDGDYTFLKS